MTLISDLPGYVRDMIGYLSSLGHDLNVEHWDSGSHRYQCKRCKFCFGNTTGKYFYFKRSDPFGRKRRYLNHETCEELQIKDIIE